MKPDEAISLDALRLDCAGESQRITAGIRNGVLGNLKKRGVVVALSGGIDSSVVGGLCVEALGRDRVFGLMLPERDSSSETPGLSQLIVDHLGIEAEHHDITDMLTAVGCYRYRDEAIASVIEEYTPEYKCKIVLPSLLESEHLRVFSVVVESPDGQQTRARLPLKAYLQIVAATNFKQRVRKMLEYFHADRLNYAVAGTPNRQEYDQGFFVKLGDGAADIKPIAHLYKTQVYQMAEYLGLPEAITRRPPTTDTYSLAQDQEEFYFSVPHDVLDLCLYAKDHELEPRSVCQALGLEREQAERVFRDIDSKRKVAHYLHSPPLLVTGAEAT
jgi:NAD+ synthase